MKKTRLIYALCSVLIMGIITTGCKDDEGGDPQVGDPIASFQAAVDETDFFQVTFTNFSQNATVFTWDFGDGVGTSTDKDPVYTYTAGGKYSVKLTAANEAGTTAEFSADVTVTDPDAQLTLLSGTSSKTWKLLREGGAALGIGPDEATWYSWWTLSNDGSRSCLFDDEFIYHRDGTFEFQANGTFWGEADYYAESDKADLNENCIEESVANLTVDGVDYSAWLSSDTHSYEYSSSAGTITLTGAGAWMGLYKLGSATYNPKGTTPPASTSFSAVLADGGDSGVDTLTIGFQYEAEYWRAIYVSYANPTDEPEMLTEAPVFGEDLADITPATMSHSFASANDFVELGTLAGGSIITVGVDDPTDAGATKVGQFDRVATDYQEAQITVSPDAKDIQFDNLTTISLDVYLPSSNNYATTLTKVVELGLADQSATKEWWNSIYKYTSDELALDTWVTLTYQIDTPSTTPAEGTSPKDRTDLDMFYINIGGAGHTVAGTFYIRNLKFE
ncbi:PKD domain-containing protein [Reichenbachiella agarivorans]|uniref:PKD domain-containing protein n=1 Tax=Reichenbachiella agarivorans TaxID=2979464 RepID=A0ABY6CWW1_9BACT|nr:PKD domain-containing protein [Reichenbachiella agarivorans]UXP32730.1 PKD domain-containing protein [Reichenbachiella agarivorans]